MWESSKFPVENSFFIFSAFTSSFPESFLPSFIVFPSKHHGSEYSCIQDKWRIDSDCCLNILNFYHFALVFVVVLSSVYSNSSLVQALTNTCMCSIQVSLWKSNQNGQSKLNGSYKHCSFNSILNGFSLSLHCFYFDCHTLVIKRCFNILFLRSIKLHISPLE